MITILLALAVSVPVAPREVPICTAEQLRDLAGPSVCTTVPPVRTAREMCEDAQIRSFGQVLDRCPVN